MPDARNHDIMDKGREMMYFTLPVKLRSRNMFPMKPHAREDALSAISLGES